MILLFFKISLLDAEPVTSFCFARVRLDFRSETFLCKVTGCADDVGFGMIVDASRCFSRCSSLELSNDESVAEKNQTKRWNCSLDEIQRKPRVCFDESVIDSSLVLL